MIPKHPGGPGRLYRVSRVNALLASREGEEAFRQGLRPSDCPYVPRDATQDWLGVMWRAGWWVAARPGIQGAWAMHFERAMKGFRADPPR